jgi:hypothetical protein
MSMINIIKQASVGAVGAQNPVNISFGEIIKDNPIEVKIDQKLILPKEFFIIPESLTRYEIDLTHNHGGGSALSKVVIREGLNKGDKVLLLRVQGGEQYIILDKVV